MVEHLFKGAEFPVDPHTPTHMYNHLSAAPVPSDNAAKQNNNNINVT